MRALALTVFILFATLMAFSLFTVFETNKAILLRLGKIQLNSDATPVVYEPGLHFKMPFADTIREIDTRVQTLEIQSSRILTEEKKDLIVDLFVKWRVKDFATYFTSTGANKFKAERLLKEQVIDGVRAEFGQRSIQEVVSGERQEVMDILRAEVGKGASAFGIEVIDTRVKRIDFPAEVSEKVYDRMRTERMRIAAEHRAEGRSKAEVIRAQSDARVTVILATAEQESQVLKGEGDAKAAQIYANAYGKDPEFYRFTRTLNAYKETFKDKNDILLLSPDSQFFEYFGRSVESK